MQPRVPGETRAAAGKREGEAIKGGEIMRHTLEERLLSKIVKQENGCWEWLGTKSRGYGRIKVLGRKARVHRVAFELWVGPIAKGLDVQH
jgi:hypothetical protein